MLYAVGWKAPASKPLSMPKKSITESRPTAFIESMECLPVTKIPEGPEWTYEFLCRAPHKISSVAFGVMWRFCFSAADKAHGLLRSAT
jgi:hypothetical protein